MIAATGHEQASGRSQTDAHLDSVALKQYGFKNEKLRAVAVAICKAMTASPGCVVWADSVVIPACVDADSRNCVGSAWRILANWGIIQRMEGAGDHRRSTAPGRRGGNVWRYRLLSPGLCRAFLRANGVAVVAPETALVQQQML